MSTHEIAIVQIDQIEPHPNPEVERMEITHIWGWQCCIGKGQFKVGDKAVYIPPDYEVPLAHPSFSFLKKPDPNHADAGKVKERIRVRRFKGAISQGLLISVPPEVADLPVGSNVIEQLGITRYEPPMPKSTGGMFVGGPSDVYAPKFDVESMQRYYATVFAPGEIVIATEKIHGANARFTYAPDKEGQMKQFCGSRTNWMGEDDKNIWWMAFHQNPDIGRWCQDHPGLLIYGEVYGQVQSLKYGAGKNDIFFAPFAILDKNKWLDYDECQKLIEGYNLTWAPFIWRGPFDLKTVLDLAEGPSMVPNANHLREGVVVVPEHERDHPEIGRVMLKAVSNEYLEKVK